MTHPQSRLPEEQLAPNRANAGQCPKTLPGPSSVTSLRDAFLPQPCPEHGWRAYHPHLAAFIPIRHRLETQPVLESSPCVRHPASPNPPQPTALK